eukprot:9214486-Pyramimonas_sp.AAC.1
MIFTLWPAQVLQALRSAKPSAAGPDGITGNMVRKLAGEMAPLLLPLFLKAQVRFSEPIQWKGGFYRPLHKKSNPASRLNYRSILGSSQLGKRFRSLLRRDVAPLLLPLAGPRQYGGVAHGGTDFAALEVRTMQQIGLQTGQSAWFFLTDVAQAFYRSVRELVFETSSSLQGFHQRPWMNSRRRSRPMGPSWGLRSSPRGSTRRWRTATSPT